MCQRGHPHCTLQRYVSEKSPTLYTAEICVREVIDTVHCRDMCQRSHRHCALQRYVSEKSPTLYTAEMCVREVNHTVHCRDICQRSHPHCALQRYLSVKSPTLCTAEISVSEVTHTVYCRDVINKSYLSNRSQSVRIADSRSRPIILKCGVLQEFPLGPFLFNIYTLPIYDIIRSHGLVFHISADDNDNYIPFKPKVCDQNLVKLRNCIAVCKFG